MTVTNRKKRGDIHKTCLSDVSNLINKRNISEHNFSTSSDSCCTNNFDEDYSLMTLTTPNGSTASWLDADDSYQADFLDEATRILHGEENFSDTCHDRLRFEYEQWKIIPHLRIIGKRIDHSCKSTLQENYQQSCQVDSKQTTINNGDLDVLRDQVIKIMTETLWKRVLDKASIKSVCQRQSSMLEPQQHSSDRIESALIVSSILPANRPPTVFKSRPHLDTVYQSRSVCHGQSNTKYNTKPWSKSNASILPPIDTHQKKVRTNKTKRWFSAINTPGKNHALPRPVTSITTHVDNTTINVCLGISIDGKSIKSLRKKGYCSPS